MGGLIHEAAERARAQSRAPTLQMARTSLSRTAPHPAGSTASVAAHARRRSSPIWCGAVPIARGLTPEKCGTL